MSLAAWWQAGVVVAIVGSTASRRIHSESERVASLFGHPTQASYTKCHCLFESNQINEKCDAVR